MSRRSSSSSHIPQPKNLFNAEGGRKRSASGNRLSFRNSTASTGWPKRRSSLSEGKQSLGRLSRHNSPSRLSKLTPQNPPKRGRPNSIQRITPHTEQKSQGSIRSGSAVKSGEKKTIQKLSTDVAWVRDQYSKVRNFITHSGLFDPSIVTENNIKPPTIKVFIYVSTVLLKELFATVKITNENYKELISEKLKVLKYPGTLANSVLKTVNTMHVWPQVIGMFGWLIDKINLLSEITYDLGTLEPFQRESYQITQVCKLYLLERYSIFNNGNIEEKNLQIKEEFVMQLRDILQVDPERYEQLEAEIAKNKEYTLKQDGEIQNLTDEISKIREENDEMKQDIDRFEEQDVALETELDGEIKYLKAKLDKIRDKKTSAVLRVASLEENFKIQSCSYLEKMNLLKSIDSLTDEIKMGKEKMESVQTLKHQFDEQLNEERMMLQKKVFQWNNALMKWVIKKPQLKPLLLKETGFHLPSYLTHIKEVKKNKTAIERDFAKELQELGTKLEQERSEIRKLELELEQLMNCVNDLTVEYNKIHQMAEEKEEELRKLTSEYEQMKKSLEQELKVLQENNDVDILQRQALQLQAKRDSLKEEVEKFAKKTLAFFLDLHTQIAKDIKKMEEIRRKAVENFVASEIEQESALIKKLEKLTTLDK